MRSTDRNGLHYLELHQFRPKLCLVRASTGGKFDASNNSLADGVHTLSEVEGIAWGIPAASTQNIEHANGKLFMISAAYLYARKLSLVIFVFLDGGRF